MSREIKTFTDSAARIGMDNVLTATFYEGAVLLRVDGNPFLLTDENRVELAELLRDPIAYDREHNGEVELFCESGADDSMSAEIKHDGRVAVRMEDANSVYLSKESQERLYGLLGRSLGKDA